MLKQGLHTKLSQSLTMTPQMQQAIRLLQLSSVELTQEIQEALDSNPLLLDNHHTPDTAINTAESLSDTHTTDHLATKEANHSDQPINDSTSHHANDTHETTHDPDINNDTPNSVDSDIPKQLEMDADWSDVFDTSQDHDYRRNGSADESTTTILEKTTHANATLHDHLTWQIHLSQLSEQDQLIAGALINAINAQGFLQESTINLHQQLMQHYPNVFIDHDEVVSVLNYIQRLDPVGIGTRNLSECLAVQLQVQQPDDPFIRQASKLMIEQPHLLEPKYHTLFKQALSLSNKQFEHFLQKLKTLNPRPANAFAHETIEYIEPDVYVKKINGRWQVSMNANMAHSLSINDHYADLLTEKGKKSDLKYLKEHLKQANWLIHSLENRNQTILKVSQAIIEQQTAFLHYGAQAMKPMILKDIAERLDMHESSISRATNRKYIHTPKGIFELKYFFSSQVSTDTGSHCSSTAIQSMIKSMIDQENVKKPLSDHKLTTLLQNQGIKVARRTVAKYREALNIPASHERKVLA
ncbi:MAG: RNA polymerase factor sigma-54 [bacterium]